MITVEQLSKRFPGREAVRGISFNVEPGEVLGFLGPNGAGKTTTMRMITGFLLPSGGRVRVCGHDVVQQPVEARRKIGYLPENAPAYGEMTVEGFLRFTAEARGFDRIERALRVEGVIERCFLGEVRRQPIETLSKGYRQRTCLAQAILHDPPVLIMDEPTDGLDPNQKAVVRSMIRGMRRDKAIILSTHVLEEVDAVCSRAVIINQGHIVADDTPERLRRHDRSRPEVHLTVSAPEREVRSVLERMKDVHRIEISEAGTAACRVRVIPEGNHSILQYLLRTVWEKGWSCRDIREEAGRLDNVFRTLTQTDDVTQKARKAS